MFPIPWVKLSGAELHGIVPPWQVQLSGSVVHPRAGKVPEGLAFSWRGAPDLPITREKTYCEKL